MNDGDAWSASAGTFTMTYTAVNDAPTVASQIADASTAEDSAYSLNVAGTCTDVDGDTLTYTISGAPNTCLLYTSPSPRDLSTSRMPSSA